MDENRKGLFGAVGVVETPFVLDPFSAPAAAPTAPRPQTGRKALPIDFVVKDDGDFSAGPGEFIPIPKASMKFVTDVEGPALFFVQAVFAWNGFSARNDHLGLLVDNTVYPLGENEVLSGTTELALLKFGASAHWAMNLAAGEHTVHVLLRGGRDEGDIKTGLTLPSKVKANHRCPLILSCIHS